jgi:predicted integral membrane protein DUF2270
MASPNAREPALPTAQRAEFSDAEIGELAHLYRGEVYRSIVWRTRLDSSTNWAVVMRCRRPTVARKLRHCPWSSSVSSLVSSFYSRPAATGISMSGVF